MPTSPAIPASSAPPPAPPPARRWSLPAAGCALAVAACIAPTQRAWSRAVQGGAGPLPPVLVPGDTPPEALPSVWDDFWFLNDCVGLGQCVVVYTVPCESIGGLPLEGKPCEYCDFPFALVSECRFTFNLNEECSEVPDASPDCGLHWTGFCRPNGTCDATWDGNRCLRSVCVGQ